MPIIISIVHCAHLKLNLTLIVDSHILYSAIHSYRCIESQHLKSHPFGTVKEAVVLLSSHFSIFYLSTI